MPIIVAGTLEGCVTKRETVRDASVPTQPAPPPTPTFHETVIDLQRNCQDTSLCCTHKLQNICGGGQHLYGQDLEAGGDDPGVGFVDERGTREGPRRYPAQE